MRSRQPLSALDAAFLQLDTPQTPLHVGALVMLDAGGRSGRGLIARLMYHLPRRLGSIPRLRCQLEKGVFSLTRPVLCEVAEFDPRDHVRREIVTDGLLERVCALYEMPLERARPLWSIHILGQPGSNRVALLFKVHHCLLDGVSAAGVLAQVADRGHGTSPPQAPGSAVPHGSALPGLARTGLAFGRRWLRNPPVRAPRTLINQRVDGRRSLATQTLPIAEMHGVAGHFGVSVNDVLLAACSGGLRAWLSARGALPESTLTALVPISLHRRRGDLGNRVSALFCPLATDVADPVARLRAIRRESFRAKRDHAHGDATAVLNAAACLAPAAAGLGRSGLAGRLPPLCNVVISNVSGTARPLRVAGAPVCHVYPFSALWHGAGLVITALSGARNLDLGLTGNPATTPDLDGLASDIATAHAVLLAATSHACVPTAARIEPDTG